MSEKIKEVLYFQYTEPKSRVRVIIPELPEDEYNRRSKIRHDTTAALLREAERVKREAKAVK